jgi:chromosomal replication initiator protein
MKTEDFWEVILSHLKKKLTSQQFKTWVKPLSFQENESDLEILAPNQFIQQWVVDRFAKEIIELSKENKYIKQIKFISNKAKKNIKPIENKVDLNQSKTKPEDLSPKSTINKTTGLNKNLNFENFVTGRANQLATAAAKQVSEKPGESYNPLFIYGGVGLGKTHLLQSIGNKVKEENKDFKVKYLHAERYVTDVVKAYEGKTFDQFKKNYHSLDLLLIDDIQFIGKKNRTQEEFFYAFNTLIENKKQIIITCDSYPKEIQGVDERLRTRFSWGLTVAIEPPELEMRVAILLKKASISKINLPEDVAFFIAKQIRSNVRELEGALNRIVALSNFTNLPIDLILAKEALKDLIAVRGRQVTVENIQKTVADYYKIKISDMVGKKRSRNFSKPRQIAMALTRELTNLSYPEIGNYFGGRHHTTVMHACEEIEEQRLDNHSLGQDLGFLTQVLRG